MVNAIDRKLLRDLGRLKGQVLTIALVVASGVASFVTLQGTWSSLQYAKNAYYERYRFSEVFVHLKRAPNSLKQRIEALPGVAKVETRVVENAMVPIDTLPEPVQASLVSLNVAGGPALNQICLRAGRHIAAGRANEAMLLESFALEHGIEPGDRLSVVINGTLRELRIVGIAMSPEFVFPMPVGGISADPKRFAVLWMDREALAPAFDLDGAFNDVLMLLQPGASKRAVRQGLDKLLAPYGGLGAVARSKQQSNYVLEGELAQLEQFATVVPSIFLAVAAFLLNVVLARLVGLQRVQIAALKALGYTNREIGWHYLKLVSVIVLLGAAIGIAVGAGLGRGFTELYTQYFRFPNLRYHLDERVLLNAAVVSLGAGMLGALSATRQVARLAPAEAMRPPAPTAYRESWLEALGLYRWVSPATRMIVREVERRPLRLILSALGIAMAVSILVVGRFFLDAMNFLIDVQFQQAWREDASVELSEPVPVRALRPLTKLPGVLYVEGHRAVPVRFRSGARFRDSVILAYPEGGRLRRVLDGYGNAVGVPVRGLAVSRKLAEVLNVSVGDTVVVELREGNRETLRARVTGLVDDAFGLLGYMRTDALAKWLRQEPLVSTVLFSLDPFRFHQLQRELKRMPTVISVTRRQTIIEQFREQSANWMRTMTLVLTIFAATIAVGVVYNNARVALSLRSRDLASLRVLGFTRREISSILIGELSVQLLLALPIGLVTGTWMSRAVMETTDPEQYRFPVVISDTTYAFAVLVTLAAGLMSALMVRRKLDRLDLIGVLKTRE